MKSANAIAVSVDIDGAGNTNLTIDILYGHNRQVNDWSIRVHEWTRNEKNE